MPRLNKITLPALLALLLAACGETPAPAPAQKQDPAPAATATAEPTLDSSTPNDQVDILLGRASAALAADQLFEPAGSNALELYLTAIAASAEDAGENGGDARRARRLSDALASGDRQDQIQLAIADIFPYGLVWVERAMAADNRPEAERVLTLLERAQPQSSALRRLRDLLDAPAPAAPVVIAATPAASASVPPTAAPTATASAAATAPAAVAASAAASATPAATPVARNPTLITAAPAAQVAAVTPPAAPAASSSRTPASNPPNALPVVLSQAAPRYPPRALRQRLEGWVLVGFTIRPDGSVNDVRVLGAEPEGVFDREAVGSMQRWQFQPPGQAITAQRRIDFKLGAR